MGRCAVCGNEYARSFEVKMAGRSETFDSFECAIHMFAPRCAHCQCAIIGHGIEAGQAVYCCAHCARKAGVEGVADNAANPAR